MDDRTDAGTGVTIAYVNTNGFAGTADKRYFPGDRKANARNLLARILELTGREQDGSGAVESGPDILFLAEFPLHSEAGEAAREYLSQMGYSAVYPDKCSKAGIRKNITSTVTAFVKCTLPYERSASPMHWLKWNELSVSGYRIVGVHIPDSVREEHSAREFWECMETHYQAHRDTGGLLYIGDMNVFLPDTPGYRRLSALCESASDVWLSLGNGNAGSDAATWMGGSRLDRAVASADVSVLDMKNYPQIYREGLSDHSLLMVTLERC